MKDVERFVIDSFLKLTSITCPHGYETELVKDYISDLIPLDLKIDGFGNFYCEIGNHNETMFASHIDTVSKDYKKVLQIVDENNFVTTDGTTTLGADDKAGMTVMLWMINNNVPGMYYFFIGEEVGCIGSGLLSGYGDNINKYKRIISFDRRGTDSIITFQSSGRCCSDSFAEDLCDELNKGGLSYEKDKKGVRTDSAEFIDIIPECTNVSVGYYKEHTTNETQDLNHLITLAKACVNVDWDNLSTKRDPKIIEPKYGYDYYEDIYDRMYSGYNGYNEYDKYDELDDEDKFPDFNNTYYDNGDGQLMNIIDNGIKDGEDKYDWIISKFTEENLSLEEIEVLKDCYLNMNDDYDIFFYEFLKEQLN